MKYDFTTIMDRKGHDATAIDLIGKGTQGVAPEAPKDGFDAIPMWVADMNFPVAPSITDAIIERAKHPAFGYFLTRGEYFDSIISWHKDRNGVDCMTKEHIGYENGVIGCVITSLNALCSKGDKVLLQSPTYLGFTHSLKDNGYEIVHNPMYIDENGVWRLDFEDMEEKIVKNNIHATVFCSPHNPCGRVWERWELEKAYEIFEKHQVYVVSDEIWSDLILGGRQHIPSQMVNEYAKMHTVGIYAPSKTFNLSGLVGSYHVIYDKWLRDRVVKEASVTHYNEMNVLSMHALIGAYADIGRQWTDELLQVLTKNVDFACDYIDKNFDGVTCAKPEGTYMLFVDCTAYAARTGRTIDEIRHACWDVGVGIQDGMLFNGPCHLRMNLALPLSRVEEAFDRMKKYVFI